VAAWFGAAVDGVHVATSREGAPRLQWGFWPLGAADMGHALAAWKGSDAASYEALLGAYGVDTIVDAEDALATPRLVVVDPQHGVLRGARAVALVARDPRRIALLARASRHPHARAAQAKTVAARAVAPVLNHVFVRGDRKVLVADVASSARVAAAVLCAARDTGLDGLSAMLDGDFVGDEALVQHAARWLLVAGQKTAAHRVRRVLSSPELL
jgi:hypothetical protein